MKRLFFTILLAVALAAQAQTVPMSPCKAIELAERHFREQGVDSSRQHVREMRVRYDEGSKQTYWEVFWSWNEVRLGGELTARIYQEGKVEWQRLGP